MNIDQLKLCYPLGTRVDFRSTGQGEVVNYYEDGSAVIVCLDSRTPDGLKQYATFTFGTNDVTFPAEPVVLADMSSHPDTARLAWLSRHTFDGIPTSLPDRYDFTTQAAQSNSHEFPTEADDLDGFRKMIDEAIQVEARIDAVSTEELEEYAAGGLSSERRQEIRDLAKLDAQFGFEVGSHCKPDPKLKAAFARGLAQARRRDV